jgi:hypothetical protein
MDTCPSLQHEVVGDIANAIWQIKERVRKQEHWDFDYFLQVCRPIFLPVRIYWLSYIFHFLS